MYYDEKKAKRVKKIKSKMYRKLLKRKKAREDEKEEEMIRETDPDAARALDEDAAYKRAEERMSLRHKHTSRYMRNLIKSRGANGEDSREIVMESIERGQELKRKMGTMRAQGESSDEDDEVERQERSDEEDDKDASADEKDQPDLFKLKFMQRGRQKRQTQMQEEEELLRRAVEEGDSDDQAFSDADINQKVASDGRMKFQPRGDANGANVRVTGGKGDAVELVGKRRGKRSKTSGSLAIGVNAGPTIRPVAAATAAAAAPLFNVGSFEEEVRMTGGTDFPGFVLFLTLFSLSHV
jgi:U3 small nucleolar RNA-associated protein 14